MQDYQKYALKQSSYTTLEIWGKAQRESTWHPMSEVIAAATGAVKEWHVCREGRDLGKALAPSHEIFFKNIRANLANWVTSGHQKWDGFGKSMVFHLTFKRRTVLTTPAI